MQEDKTMAVRSTTSQFQPIPPNYTTQAGPYYTNPRYRQVTSATPGPIRANMCTAPVPNNNGTQFFYVPRLNG